MMRFQFKRLSEHKKTSHDRIRLEAEVRVVAAERNREKAVLRAEKAEQINENLIVEMEAVQKQLQN